MTEQDRSNADVNNQRHEHDLHNRILTLFNNGAIGQALLVAAECVENFPQSPFGWKMLGICQAMLGETEKAIQALTRVVKLMPNDHESHGNLALVLQQSGSISRAIEEFQLAISLHPSFAEAHFNLGNLYKSEGLLSEAIRSYETCIKIRPDFEAAYLNLGNTLSDQREMGHAREVYEQLLVINPSHFQACNNLGTLLDANGEHELARWHYSRALVANPHFHEAYLNLGDSFRSEFLENEAIVQFQHALLINPASAEAHFKIAKCLQTQGEFVAASQYLREAIRISPDHAEAHLELGRVLDSMIQHSSEAMDCYSKALALSPNLVAAMHHQALGYSSMGEHDKALSIFRKAINIEPGNTATYHGQLCCLNYHPDHAAEEIYSYYEEYSSRLAEPLRKQWIHHQNQSVKEKRLKVGYVASTFYLHSSIYFLEPLLSRHDKSQVELYAYAQARPIDHGTERYKSYVDHWVETRGMDDDALAERIRQDGIDILVDIAGHTGHNRLQVFARKPAPVSLHWLDFGYTTGLKAIDYYLTDWETVPEGSEGLFSEALWRLDVPALVYRPAEGMGEVNALPALDRGYVTFGTLTRAVRINYKTIRAWSEILKAVPHSKLVVNSVSYVNPEMQRKLKERFAAHGIGSERLEIGMSSPPWDVLRGIDIGLDCFPHNSGTTLFETLYMGVPFVTLRDRPSVGRLGSSILKGLGHSEWIADTEDEYVEKAVALAGDRESLSVLRGRLRDEMQGSALMDEVGFARAVEDAYRQMWQRWCEKALR